MRKLLDEISVIPGVTGSCIFDRIEGPICKDLHPSLPEELLQKVGIHLVRLMKMGSMSGLTVRSSLFYFHKYSVMGMPLDDGSVLLTICDAEANCSLVATTAAMLAADMREELDRGVTKSDLEEEVTDSVVQETQPDQAEETVAEDLGDGSELEQDFAAIETVLANAVGPIAGLLMQDYIEKWKGAGPAVRERLPELADMLLEEIGDQDLAKDYSRQIRDLF